MEDLQQRLYPTFPLYLFPPRYIRKIKGPGARTHYPFSTEEAARVDALSSDEIEAMFWEEAQRMSRKSSRFIGVKLRGMKWNAYIEIPGIKGMRRRREISFGYHEDERSAACIYDAASWALWGRCEAKENGRNVKHSLECVCKT